MDRRTFLSTTTAAIAATVLHSSVSGAEKKKLKPRALGLLVSPFGAPEATIGRVHDLGFTNCFLSLGGYLGRILPANSRLIQDLLTYSAGAITMLDVGRTTTVVGEC